MVKPLLINLFYLLFLIVFSYNAGHSFAQTPSDTPTPTPQSDNSQKIEDLQNRIREYEDKIKNLQGTKKTLTSQIALMDNQMKLTEFKIADAEKKIVELQKDINITVEKVDDLEENIENSTKVLLERVRASYKAGYVKPWEMFLASDNLTNFFNKLKYLRIVQVSDKKRIYANEQSKVNYEAQQVILEDKKNEEKLLQDKLERYTNQLTSEKTSKQQLLSITQNDEDKYQKLLREARSQIAAFKSFTSSMGGQSILPPQPSPDGWYYNQRDERWGRNNIGSSSEQVWDVGCLITATAMVRKQKGENVTPADIAADSSNFFSDTAYMLIPWNGGRFQSIWQQDFGAIDSRLASGQPVIVGVRAGVYGQHFIVLKSGANGDYIMNDPWYGPDLRFSEHYSTSQIFQYGYLK